MLLAQNSGASTAPPQILGRLSHAAREILLTTGRQRTFVDGEILFSQGDRHDGIFLIRSGLVRSYYVSEGARELTLGFWGEGHFVGAPQMFGGGCHAWTSVANGPALCLFLPGAALKALSERHSDLCMALLDALSHKSLCYCSLLQLLATNSMKVRLARLVCALSMREGPRSTLTHGQLASMIGSTRQWVSRALASFETDGLVERAADGSLNVLRPDELAALDSRRVMPGKAGVRRTRQRALLLEGTPRPARRAT